VINKSVTVDRPLVGNGEFVQIDVRGTDSEPSQ
jgi:hypothetical protein